MLSVAILSTLLIVLGVEDSKAAEPINIGLRLEPLVDDYLIDQRAGNLELKLHRPVRHPEAVTLDQPWEGNNGNYATVLKHEDTFLFYYRGTGLVLKDGFVSASSPMAGGSLVTKPIIFAGNALQINFETSANGSVRVELQDLDDSPLPGFSLDEVRHRFAEQRQKGPARTLRERRQMLRTSGPFARNRTSADASNRSPISGVSQHRAL